MQKDIFLAALVGVTFAATLLTHVGESGASFHLNRIDGAMAGANGDSTIQYVELRSADAGENFVGTYGAVLCFYDSTGAPYAEFKFDTPDPSNGADGASILVGTAEFDAAWAAGSPDITFSPANTTAIAAGADTAHPIRSPGGKISFGTDGTLTPSLMCQSSFSNRDSVAYGTTYTGAVDFGTKLASDLPTSSTSGLHLQGPVCMDSGYFSTHPCASPRDNSVNYAIVDENASGNQPANNSGLSGPMNNDSDGDGVADFNDNCPFWPNSDQQLPPWTVPAADSDCDGFTTTQENFVGTSPLVACGTNTWPLDLTNDQVINISDLSFFVGTINTTMGGGPPYSVRIDFTTDSVINISDLSYFVGMINQSCTP